MDELTGDALLGDSEPPRAPGSNPAPDPMRDFDAIDLETEPPPARAANAEVPAAPPAGSEPLELADIRTTGKVKTGPVLGAEQIGSRPPTPRPYTKKISTGPISAPRAVAPEAGPARALVSSALTGLLGATLAIGVLVIFSLNDDSGTGWLGMGPSNDVVATRVVSGLYDTAAGKPVFFVRGRIENHGKRVRGPVRVTAELMSDGSAEAKAETLAGAEPTAEDVYFVRSRDDAAKLSRALDSAKVPRKVQPGESIPFFALIAEPPADLVRHRLHLKVEPVDAWHQPVQAAKVR